MNNNEKGDLNPLILLLTLSDNEAYGLIDGMELDELGVEQVEAAAVEALLTEAAGRKREVCQEASRETSRDA